MIGKEKLSHKAEGGVGWRAELLASLGANLMHRGDVGRGVFDVAEEPGLSALFPIRRIVGVDAGTAAQATEERMFRRTDHDSHVSRPNNQVSRLWTGHSLEVIGSVVKVGRTCIRIGKTSAKINRMYQVRTITLPGRLHMSIKSGSDYRQAIVGAQNNRLSTLICFVATDLSTLDLGCRT